MKIVTSEFTKTLETLIKNLRVEDFSDTEEYKLAQKYNALPLGVDLYSYVFLTANGEILWDDNEGETGCANDLQSLIRALVVKKERYPQFVRFIPDRTTNSKDCPICGGTGVNENSKDLRTGDFAKCFLCAGLGWVTKECFDEIIRN